MGCGGRLVNAGVDDHHSTAIGQTPPETSTAPAPPVLEPRRARRAQRAARAARLPSARVVKDARVRKHHVVGQ